MKLLKGLLLIVVFITAQSAWSAEISDEKREKIDELLMLTGAANVSQMFSRAFVQQMSSMLKQTKPDVDPRAFDIIEKEVNDLIYEQMVGDNALNKMSYPIYDRYFSTAELSELIQFYKTPIGQKAVDLMPSITQEAMQAGKLWAQSIAPELQRRVAMRFEAEGIVIH